MPCGVSCGIIAMPAGAMPARTTPVPDDLCNLLQVAVSSFHLLDRHLDDELRPLVRMGLAAIGQAGRFAHAAPPLLARLVFEPLPDALKPSLLILVAPFAVGFSTYIATTGGVDLFAEALYALNLLILAVLLGRLRRLGDCCPFRVS